MKAVFLSYIMNNTVYTQLYLYYLYGRSDYMFRHIRVILRSLHTVCVILNYNTRKIYLFLYIKKNVMKTLKYLTRYTRILYIRILLNILMFSSHFY